MNQANGGKKPDLFDVFIKEKGSKIIAKSKHNEEGARFWQKKNENLLIFLNDPRIKK